MSNPLLMVLRQNSERRNLQVRKALAEHEGEVPTATIFLVMRRMRTPLIVLIVTFSVSVVGLALIPGVDEQGRHVRMTLFDAFYVISYTATTIGFGELPWPFTVAQRLWLTVSIYVSVVGWAYAIGSMLSLLGDPGFRRAFAMRRFARRVRRLREPFLLLAGYGQTGRQLVRSFDELGQRVVVLDTSDRRIELLALDSLHADVPGLVADASNPHYLGLAGLGHACCSGVLALTDNEEANLAMSMTSALLRPELPVFTRTRDSTAADRLQAFGSPAVVNPYDLFGTHLRLALRAPSSLQLMHWIAAGPGAELPERAKLPPSGRWVVCGYGRLGRRLTKDFAAAGIAVTIVDQSGKCEDGGDVIEGDAAEPSVLAKARLNEAVGIVAGTRNDTTNLSIVATARSLNPELFVAARQNRQANSALFAAIGVDSLLIPAEAVAQQVYAQISTPLLWRFLRGVPRQGQPWAEAVVERLSALCGSELPPVWVESFDGTQAPALGAALRRGEVSIGDLLRDPQDRDRQLDAMVLLLLRGDEASLCPDDDVRLANGDRLLIAGAGHVRRQLQLTMMIDSTAVYVLTGQRIPEGLVWRKLTSAFGRDGAQ